MKLTANKIIEIYTSFEALATKDLDLNTSFIIAKNLEELSTVKDLADKKRSDLIKRFSKKDGEGNIIQSSDGSVKISDIDNFYIQLEELLSSETDVNITSILKSSLSEIKISPKNILPILEYLREEG